MRKLDKPYSGSDFSRYQASVFARTSREAFGQSYQPKVSNPDLKWSVVFGIVLALVAIVLL